MCREDVGGCEGWYEEGEAEKGGEGEENEEMEGPGWERSDRGFVGGGAEGTVEGQQPRQRVEG